MKRWKAGAPYGRLKTEVVDEETGRAVATVWIRQLKVFAKQLRGQASEPWPEGEDNLNLVLAAPGLLRACEEALDYLGDLVAECECAGPFGAETQCTQCQLRIAIAKAKGEE